MLKSRKGSIFLFTIPFVFLVFAWSNHTLKQYMYTLKAREYMDKVEDRLTIEQTLILYFRLIDEDFYGILKGNVVIASKIENKILVSVVGNMSYYFEYDIMIDGSFKLTTLEEKL